MQEIFVGLGENTITPEHCVSLFPFNHRNRQSKKILDDIYVKTVFIKSLEEKVLVVNLDLIWLEKKWCNKLKIWIEKKFTIHPANVLICATHNHSSPLPNEGKDPRYIEYLTGQVHKAIFHAVNNARPGYLSIGSGTMDVTINRRKRILDLAEIKKLRLRTTIANRPNSNGLCDHSIIIIKLYSVNQTPIASVINFACHPTIFRGNALSADFPGYISELMKQRYGEKHLTLFLQGFSGNIRPKLLYKPQLSYKKPFLWLWHKLFDPVLFKINGDQEDLDAFAEKIVNKLDAIQMTRQNGLDLVTRQTEIQLSLSGLASHKSFNVELSDADKTQNRLSDSVLGKVEQKQLGNVEQKQCVPFCIQYISISKNIKLLAMEGEVFTEYALWMKERFEKEGVYVLPVSCANGMVGYIPDAKAIYEGGYEPERSLDVYGLQSVFSAHIEMEIKSAINNLMN